tara:strand:+ start:731 stop:835 length:105 start_codon:yes stop_codon:yes gene_type:complete
MIVNENRREVEGGGSFKKKIFEDIRDKVKRHIIC